jgi:xylulokinase
MALVIGVDSSTQSVKVEVRDLETGKLWGSGKHAHPATTPPRSEQDPAAWWQALIQAVHAAGCYEDIVAISVGGQQHGMVALDAAGEVIRPAKLWNDTESADAATALVSERSPDEWAIACGSVPVAAFTVSKIAWMKQHEPENYARLASVLLPHDWLTYKLTGKMVTDRGDASGTGYWSPAEGRWRTDLLRTFDPSLDWASMLPLVLSPFETAGKLAESAALPLNLHGDQIVVGPGTGDNMAAALGLGLQPGDVVISLGTSGTVYAVSSTPTSDPSGSVAGFADASGHFLPLVCTLNAMKVTDAVARLLGVDHAGFEALVLDEPVGASGLVLLPYLDGERTPNRPNATGVLQGIRSDVRRSQLARASVEGVVCGLLDGLDALSECGVQTDGRLFLIGGGSRSAAFRQTVADLAQRPVFVPDADEHVATGACLQAAAVWLASQGRPTEGIVGALSKAWGLGGGSETQPNPAADAAALRAAYAALRDSAGV